MHDVLPRGVTQGNYGPGFSHLVMNFRFRLAVVTVDLEGNTSVDEDLPHNFHCPKPYWHAATSGHEFMNITLWAKSSFFCIFSCDFKTFSVSLPLHSQYISNHKWSVNAIDRKFENKNFNGMRTYWTSPYLKSKILCSSRSLVTSIILEATRS